MAIAKGNIDVRRQTILVAEQDVLFDETENGATINVMHLPAGARVLNGWVDNLLDVGALDIGDTVATTPDTDKYAAAAAVSTLTKFATNAPVTDGVFPNGGAYITATTTGVATSGKARVHVEYIVEDRSTEVHPVRW